MYKVNFVTFVPVVQAVNRSAKPTLIPHSYPLTNTLLNHGPVESSKDKGKSLRLISLHTIHTCAIKTDPQVQIRLSIQRLRTLQEKRLALAKKSRREIADLLLKGRLETSKLRVEGLIQDDIYVELLELLEVRHVPSLRLSGVSDKKVIYGEATS
jgi:hypothetical protein